MSQRGARSAASLVSLLFPALLAGGSVAALVPLLGQGIAAQAATGRWVWPSRPLEGLSGLLHGHPGAGVVASRPLPSTAAIYGWTALVGLLVLLLCGGVGWLLYLGVSGRGMGYAGVGETRRTTGVRRLRSARRELRPDLYCDSSSQRFEPRSCGVRVGRRGTRHGLELWSRADRTLGVIGPQGCGKSLDLLLPALMDCPGPALVTLTKPQDLLLVLAARSADGRPVLVLDPFQLAPGLPQLIWDPLTGCADPVIAARRAKAFAAGTIRGATSRGTGDDAARFYAAEAVKVLTAFFHAAALTGRSLEDLIGWVARPQAANEAVELLRQHPMAEPYLDGQLASALFNPDSRTAGNTQTTVHQAMCWPEEGPSSCSAGRIRTPQPPR
jgi:type IV secretion system protein VirD4